MNTIPDPALLRELFAAVRDPAAEPFEIERLAPERALAAAPDYAALIELWLERRGAERVPDWADVDFADFRGWHSALMISDFTDGEPDPRIRLTGEDLRLVENLNLVGLRFSELVPHHYERQLREHFRQVREQGLIGLVVAAPPLIGRDQLELRVLELPFRHGGDGVERLLHATIFGRRRLS